MTFEERHKALIYRHRRDLVEAAKALDDPALAEICRGEVLGASARREFLAAADGAVKAADLSAEEVANRVTTLIEGTQVLYRTKRAAILRIGRLICVAGTFGVVSYHLPQEPFAGMGYVCQHFVPTFNDDLLGIIGAVADGRDRGDTVYNYADCQAAEPA